MFMICMLQMILHVHDLHAADAVYHRICSANFRTMNQIPAIHEHIHSSLKKVRRSDRYWAGLSSDLVIEQVLMRSMKTSGGLTRGQGMSEQL